jgi:tritrans,polycis-undecaprenyl-diphosphate synthase [geranylgeranyl-diphosphate specific]
LSLLGVYRLYERWLRHQVENGRKPEHIAIILDGNRRWASGLSMNPWIGHRQGAEKTEDLLEWCLDLGVKSITLYAFSTENFQRASKEVREVMQIVCEKLGELLEDERIHRNKIRVKVIGRPNLLPKNIQEITARVETATKDYDEHFLNLALAYGGRAEIVDAARRIAERVRSGNLDASEIDEALFEKYLYTSHMPQQEPDLVIRTSGEERLSGFLLWQSAYSELCFLDVYWPAFRKIDLLRAIRTFQMRKRRYGQ